MPLCSDFLSVFEGEPHIVLSVDVHEIYQSAPESGIEGGVEGCDKRRNDGIRFVIIVDESHQNNTIKADEIIQYFHTDKIIHCSATPKGIAKVEIIEIPEEEVIVAGLIKKMLVINQDFPQTIETEDQTAFLLEKALQKQRELRAAFLQKDTDINPLIVIQIPNKSETLQDGVERYLETQGLTYENGQLAVWLSDQHENLEGIDEPNAATSAVIIKQAVATGWDCPRAHILVKLRDNMDETFEIQTIGRIRRMPDVKHYQSDLLDSCYLYTLDEKFTAGVKMALDKGALNACTLFLKNEYKVVELIDGLNMPRGFADNTAEIGRTEKLDEKYFGFDHNLKRKLFH